MSSLDSLEKVEVTDAESLRTWLEANHLQQESIWLVTYKKSAEPSKYVSREQVLDELIAFGWVDGIRRKVDNHRTKQLISPRKSQHWARTYKDRAAKLEKQGRMHPAGRAAIQQSKDLGLWDFMDDVDLLIIPDDLKQALSKMPKAEAFFSELNDSSKRFALRWLKLSKTTKTRRRRIVQLVELSSRSQKLKGS